MKMHKLTRKTAVNKSIDEVFCFFSDAANLERITPSELNFSIVTPQPLEIKQDSLIEYELRLFGLKFTWLTVIAEWDPPRKFVDVQLKGPYKYWHHTHSFYSLNGQTVIEDEVLYRLPFFPFGEIMYPIIKLQLNRIFNYRQKTIKKLFDRNGIKQE